MMQEFRPPQGATVAVGISGGVDSSVAAYLLKKAGYRVLGIFMKNWEELEGASSGYCTAADDVEDARDVCETLGIPLHTVNFAAAYRERVFTHFLAEYQAGRTPNPDVLCNREIKFRELWHYAQSLGADYLATGHYARRGDYADAPALFKGLDAGKDQSYFLHQITPEQLACAVFPLGGLQKKEVRALARDAGLVTFDKKDSTGICFIGERPFRAFLEHYLPAQPGLMRTPEGQIVGEHQGLMYYTLGQRQGLGIGGVAGFPEAPWFVLGKDLARNELIVGQGEHPLLYRERATVGQLSWLNAPPQAGPAQVKIRYRQRDQACTLSWGDDGRIALEFAQAQRAVTPGQYAVFYDGARCLGGGVIDG